MNKYKDALDEVLDKLKTLNGSEYHLPNASINLLRELVGKETPKEFTYQTIMEGTVAICPTCYKIIDKDISRKRCEHCGQLLIWPEESN